MSIHTDIARCSCNVFRNTEILTLRDGRIVLAEVYLGWNVNA
jgi:hypothetical protein